MIEQQQTTIFQMHSKPVPPPKTRGTLAGAYVTLQSSKKAPGKNEQMIDNVGGY